MPEPGFRYANYFIDYSFDNFDLPEATHRAQNNAAEFIDINASMLWSKKKMLGAT